MLNVVVALLMSKVGLINSPSRTFCFCKALLLSVFLLRMFIKYTIIYFQT